MKINQEFNVSISEQETRTLLEIARKNVGDILEKAIECRAPEHILIVADENSELACILGQAYRQAAPAAEYIHFDAVTPDEIHAAFARLSPRDTVVLVQSTSFRLDEYRLRVELFKRELKVIEHPHLQRLAGDELAIYVDSLAYDPAYFRTIGHALKRQIDQCQTARLDSGGAELHFPVGLESAKLNVGDYSAMQNVGGQFPIGEVFTESRDLTAVHGEVRIFVFGDSNFRVNKPDSPITLKVQGGQVVDVIDSTPEFDEVLNTIRAHEEVIWVRELGFGLNRAFSVDRRVGDIGTYERMCGIHLSLGAKHGAYAKPEIKRKDSRFHVDVFAVTEAVYLDDMQVYQNGMWQP